MTKSSSNITLCTIIALIVLIIILLISTFEFILPYANSQSYHMGECNITNVVYPTELPVGEDGGPAWSSCDCGRNCISWTPCVSLYANITGVGEVRLSDEYYDNDYGCTFLNANCPDGEDYRVIEEYMIESRETYLEYQNQTVDCYISEDKPEVFLSMEINMSQVVFFSTVGGIIFLGIMGCIWGAISQERQRKKNAKGAEETDVEKGKIEG